MIYFIYGPENFLSQRHLNKVLHFYTRNSPLVSSLDYSEKSYLSKGDEAKIEELKPLFSSKSLFSSTKVLVLKNLFHNSSSEFQRKLLQLLREFKIDKGKDIMVIIYENQDVKKSPLKEWIEKNAVRKQFFPALSSRETANWLRKEEKRYQIHFTPLARETLLLYFNNNLRGLDQALQKIALLQTKNINKVILEQVINFSTQSNMFKFLDKIIEKRFASANYFLEIELQRGTPPLLLLKLLVNQFRNILRIKSKRSSSLTNKFSKSSGWKIHPFVRRKLLPVARALDWDVIRKIYSRLLFYDKNIKSGVIEGKIGIEMLLTDIKHLISSH
ncbi:DNA polymerase III subunit delta [bacterium]|nr:DNA polymerase III subunit delta [bacterium]